MSRTLIPWLLAFVLSAPICGFAQEATSDKSQGATATAPATVDINTATAVQLTDLPGIGPKTAERIVEYREKNGPFKKIEDLMNVKGIGEKSFLKLKPRLTASDPASKD